MYDWTDNCLNVPNDDQGDANGDGIGDACTPCEFPFFAREPMPTLSSRVPFPYEPSLGTCDAADPTMFFLGFSHEGQYLGVGGGWEFVSTERQHLRERDSHEHGAKTRSSNSSCAGQPLSTR